MFGGGRHVDHAGDIETYVTWVTRVTRQAEQLMTAADAEDWLLMHRRRQLRFAGKCARQLDGRWNAALLTWRPSCDKGRRVGRPYLRWDDCLQELAGSEWTEEAKDEHVWYALSEGYIFRSWL